MTRTTQQNSEWWQQMATRYDAQAAAATTAQGRQKWEDRAHLARISATTSLSPPAPSEAQTANPL